MQPDAGLAVQPGRAGGETEAAVVGTGGRGLAHPGHRRRLRLEDLSPRRARLVRLEIQPFHATSVPDRDIDVAAVWRPAPFSPKHFSPPAAHPAFAKARAAPAPGRAKACGGGEQDRTKHGGFRKYAPQPRRIEHAPFRTNTGD